MDVLKPLIEQLVKTMQGSADLAKGQFPDVAQQIIRVYLWGNVIEIPILLGVMFLGWKGIQWAYRETNETSDPWLFLLIPIGIAEVIVGVYAYGCLSMLLKSILAPKLVIIEALRAYIR